MSEEKKIIFFFRRAINYGIIYYWWLVKQDYFFYSNLLSTTNSDLYDTHMDKLGDGFLPLSARIPRWLRVEIELLPVKCLP